MWWKTVQITDSELYSTLFITFAKQHIIAICMKHIISIIVALVISFLGFAQEIVSKVVLKNGVTITGRIVELNPVSHIILNVAGFDTRVEMSDIDSIKEVKNSESSESIEGIKIVDTTPYDETPVIQVGPYSIEMVLVRGAIFEMGYDGRGSRLLFSEPVHTVQLSSFYINKSPLSKGVVDYVMEGKEARNDHAFNPNSWKNANQAAEALARKTNLPIRLISEAQCEYVAVSEYTVDKIDIKKNEVVYCYDFFAEYKKTSTPQLDPLGPEDGKDHVIRFLDAKDQEIYNRIEKTSSILHVNSLRFTLPASAL